MNDTCFGGFEYQPYIESNNFNRSKSYKGYKHMPKSVPMASSKAADLLTSKQILELKSRGHMGE